MEEIMKDVIAVKDVKGNWVVIKPKELQKAVKKFSLLDNYISAIQAKDNTIDSLKQENETLKNTIDHWENLNYIDHMDSLKLNRRNEELQKENKELREEMRKRSNQDNALKDAVCKTIAKYYPFSSNEIKSALEKLGSFDLVSRLCDSALQNNIPLNSAVDGYLNTHKNFKSENFYINIFEKLIGTISETLHTTDMTYDEYIEMEKTIKKLKEALGS